MIESPYYPEGVGTIYMDAINVFSDSTEVTVEIATNMIDYIYAGGPTNIMLPEETVQYSNNWQVVDVLSLNAATSNDFTRYQRTLNYRQAAKVRVRRTGTVYAQSLDNALTAIDNLRVSPPPSDVVIKRSNVVFQPGYPSCNTGLLIRCYVDNLDPNVPTSNNLRSVTAYYRWRYLDQASNAWASVPMSLASNGDGRGNGERYEASLPVQQQVGDLEYYFKCDFQGFRYKPSDYTLLSYSYYPSSPEGSESLSPRTLRGGASEPDGREFYARLRPFYSRFGKVSVVTDQHAQPIEMTLVSNEVWRGMVPLNNGAITNVSWFFKGENAYVPGADAFSTNPVYWAEPAQAAVEFVPYGGFCSETTPSSRITALVDAGGYLQVVLNTSTLEFMASRAEYQNFNAWPAPPDTFTDSGGQASKQNFPNSFDAWPTNTGLSFSEYFIGQDAAFNAHTNYTREPFSTFNGWLAGSAAYVRERLDADMFNKPADGLIFRNIALRLKGGSSSLGLGYVHNTLGTRPDGLQQISFKARVGQPLDRNDVAYQKFGFSDLNYAILADVKADTGLSPENPSMSVIGYYKDPDNFYEFRMTQVTNAANLSVAGDRRMHFQLFKWVSGVPYQLAISRPNENAVLTDNVAIEMRLFNAAGGTQILCRFGTAGWAQVINITDNGTQGGPAIQSGSYGFLSADCRARLSNVRTQPTANGPILSGAVTVRLSASQPDYASQIVNWYLPTGRFGTTPTLTTPEGIYSVIPTQRLGVYLQSSDRDSSDEPAAPGTTNWVKYTEVSLASFANVATSVPINNWRSQYVMLQVMGREDGLNVDVAVDELKVSPWRGQLSCDSGDPDEPQDEDWAATEAWVVSNATVEAHVVQLDHSRADPDEDQAVRSLLLTNGIGMLEFDYRVVRPPAKLTVQFATDFDSSMWYPVQSIIVSNVMGSFQHALAYVGTNQPGYLRVLNERSGGYTNALVEINNVIAWDEPYIDDASWRAYNVKVTDTDKMRVLLDESKGCFLNNSATADAQPAQTQYDPFVQSPRLPGGLGSLTFLARAYSNNQPAKVSVWVTTVGWGAPTNDWFKAGEFSVSNTLYQSYTYAPADGRTIKSVKLVTGKTAADRRACIEEVAVSEPIFPGFKIVNVKTLCKDGDGQYSDTRFQPLDSDEVGIEARISNIQLKPKNIQMFVSYYVGTNIWGAANWPSNAVVTKPMYPIPADTNTYRTSPANDLPIQEKDAVIQYRVWARYQDDEGVFLQTQQEVFDNPSWYYPLDLNQTYAALGWSPYYIVYGVPLNTVWINEVNAVDVATNGVHHYGENSYLEIAVPVGVDLAGWKIDLVNNVGNTTTITIPAGQPTQQEVTNGYAFFVVGDMEPFRPNKDTVPALPKLDLGYYRFADALPDTMPGGIRLRRPLGMYEHTVAYDWNPIWPGFSGEVWADSDPEGKFVYVGRESQGGSLNVTNGAGVVMNDWVFPLTWTPGGLNIGQRVPNAILVAPGISNAVVVSTMNTAYGSQNGKRLSPLTFKVRKGDDTNILYVADSWYRLHGINVNGVELMTPGQELISQNLQFSNVQTNLEIAVNVGLRSDIAALGVSGPVLNWLLNFEDKPLVPSYYYGRELTLTELFWLNADPTRENVLEGGLTKVEKTAQTNFYVTSWLSLNGQNCTNLQGDAVFKISVKNDLAAPKWEMIAQYAFSTNSFDAAHTNRTFIFNPYLYQLIGWDQRNLFFRWVIEMEDPRFAVEELINQP